MKAEFWGSELAYKRGVEDALNENALRQAICAGLQKTPYVCSDETRLLCVGPGDCACCGIIARTIREKKKVD